MSKIDFNIDSKDVRTGICEIKAQTAQEVQNAIFRVHDILESFDGFNGATFDNPRRSPEGGFMSRGMVKLDPSYDTSNLVLLVRTPNE